MTDQTKYAHKLKGARTLVIGGTSGIGYGVAESLIEHGATVVISSSNPDKIAASIRSLRSSYPSVTDARLSGHACDLASADTMESNLTALLDAATANNTLKLDHIVYTAGDALGLLPIATATMPKITQAGMVRFFGPLILGKLAPNYMNPGPASSITLTTGSVSQKPHPGWTVVNAYATGAHGICRGLALDLAPIRVNLISPGAVKTELWATAGITGETAEKMFKEEAGRMATGNMGEVIDLVEPYMCAMRDRNMTGTMLSSNGGALLM